VLTTIRKRLNSEEGFTLVELLVVILIIGILAAIAIPSFLNQKGKGEDASAKASVREAATALETYYTDNGKYDGATPALLKGIEGTLPVGASADAAAGTAANADKMWVILNGSPISGYTIKVWSKPSARLYSITKASDGTVTRSCEIANATDNKGGCSSVSGTTGSW
jgi:type IV pilus assembly protein PilA